eukprot:CAMPEP_0172484750 /NCGR_PEP_ID=MMETSP1066-20121228/12336_1 /TAXON_ID=671091 /ORGANISM="Coscinodiscus wailesii, Strain CCMP2513" /LENGTH=311 /DNA_ID=CAMNT_0013249471 /DNA_START=128 /DNA_END=1063 /DNA_ORIENTATION=-
MAPTNNKRSNDGNLQQADVRKRKTEKGRIQLNNTFYTLAKENTGDILSFLKIKDIGAFRITSKYFLNNFKISYTEEHCRTIANNLGRIYESGGLQNVRRILSDDSRVNPSHNDDQAIIWASESGHLDLVLELLKNPRVNPEAQDNRSIFEASAKGHLSIVRALLKDSRVDPSDDDNSCICWASCNGHLDVVKVLLSDDRVNPSNEDNYPIGTASVNGHLEIVRVILDDWRLVLPKGVKDKIRTACENENLDMIKALLRESHVYPYNHIEFMQDVDEEYEQSDIEDIDKLTFSCIGAYDADIEGINEFQFDE